MNVRHAILSSLKLLGPRDRRLLGFSIAIQMATAVLDLVGVLLIGLVGALAVTTVQSQPAPPMVSSVADRLGMQDLSDQGLVLALSGAAAIVLLTKSVLSSYLTRRVFIFLANRQALVSARLARELLSRPLTFVQKRSSQETAYALISGAGAATSMVLGHLVVVVTELFLLLVLGVALLVLNPWVALGAIGFFCLVAVGLQRAMGGWATRVGALNAQADIASLNAIQEALGAYREITVANRRALYVDRIQRLRWQAAKVSADTLFISMFPKYMFEAALVVGGFALAGLLFATQDSVAAVGTLALFFAAGTRVMPSLLRLQGATLGLRSAAGTAGPTFALADELNNPMQDPLPMPDARSIRASLQNGHPGFIPSVKLSAVTLTYPGSRHPALNDVSLEIHPGQSVALVGPSGAGKSTIADVVLGVLQPDDGQAVLCGSPPTETISKWPGAVAYVPQDVVLANDTLRANVALGLPDAAVDDERVWEALDRAHLGAYLRSSGQTLDTVIGERGMRLSGGQRQRLGIARAMFSRPQLLVLDEATSALDAETEEAITRMLGELEGRVTTIVIAHRLSTVRGVDSLVYVDHGRVLAQGTFDDVLSQSSDFQRQAALMGLA